MQHIDYNSSILVALLSGINLACLDMHAVKGTRWRSVESGLPLSLVVFTARSSFSFTLAPFWYKLAPELPLCYRLLTPGCGCCARRCYGVFESVTKTNPIEFFGDRSCPAHSIRHHLPLSDRLIGTGRMYHRSRRSASALLCWWWPRGGAMVSTSAWRAPPAAAHEMMSNWFTHTA